LYRFVNSWRSGEPNNVGGNEDCVLVKPNSGFKWWDIKCSREYNGLCETEPFELTNPSCEEGDLMFGGELLRKKTLVIMLSK